MKSRLIVLGALAVIVGVPLYLIVQLYWFGIPF